MKIKSLLLISLIACAVFAQQISLINFLKGNQTTLPPNCLKVDKDNRCTTCDDGYELKSGECKKIINKDGSSLPMDSSNDACDKKSICGDAKSFSS